GGKPIASLPQPVPQDFQGEVERRDVGSVCTVSPWRRRLRPNPPEENWRRGLP
ncbi:unnamed protein product, partial [Ascophyllum nodosum]